MDQGSDQGREILISSVADFASPLLYLHGILAYMSFLCGTALVSVGNLFRSWKLPRPVTTLVNAGDGVSALIGCSRVRKHRMVSRAQLIMVDLLGPATNPFGPFVARPGHQAGAYPSGMHLWKIRKLLARRFPISSVSSSLEHR